MAFQSGTITGTTTVRAGTTPLFIRVVWTESSSPTPNSSVVTASYQMKRDAENFSTSSTFFITINGITANKTNGYTYPDDNAWHQIFSSSTTIAHDANGSKSITISAGGVNSGTSWLTATLSGTAVLDDFVRVPNAPSTAPTLSRISSGTSITVTSDTTPALSPAGPSITDYAYRQSTDGSSWGSAVSMGTDRTITITGLTSTQRYYYQTRAVNSDGAGAWSATRDILGVPAAPTGFRHGFLDSTETATTSTTIALDWGGYTADVGRYRVEYKRTVDSTWTDTGYSGTTTAHQVTGLAVNTLYDFRVSAINTTLTPNLVSAYSTLSTPTVPATPTNLRVGYLDASASPTTSRDISLDWDDDTSGVTNFKVEYKEASSETWLPTTYTGTTSSFKVTGLTFNTEYDFRVAAENTSRGTISLYAEVSDTTLPGGPPVRKDAFTWAPSELYVCTDDDPETWELASMYAWNGTSWKAVG